MGLNSTGCEWVTFTGFTNILGGVEMTKRGHDAGAILGIKAMPFRFDRVVDNCERFGAAIRRVVFYKEELLFRWSDAETGISGIERDKELLLREVFVNC
jgi:hypothetical protein